jgi:hypothetical protein
MQLAMSPGCLLCCAAAAAGLSAASVSALQRVHRASLGGAAVSLRVALGTRGAWNVVKPMNLSKLSGGDHPVVVQAPKHVI